MQSDGDHQKFFVGFFLITKQNKKKIRIKKRQTFGMLDFVFERKPIHAI